MQRRRNSSTARKCFSRRRRRLNANATRAAVASTIKMARAKRTAVMGMTCGRMGGTAALGRTDVLKVGPPPRASPKKIASRVTYVKFYSLAYDTQLAPPIVSASAGANQTAGAEGGNRTHTSLSGQGILSPLRLPI